MAQYRQGGYVDTAKGISRDPVAFAISFSSVPGLAWTCDYLSSRSTSYVTQTGFGTNINEDRRNATLRFGILPLACRQGGYARNTFTYPISCIPLGAWVIKHKQGYADNPAITSLTNTNFQWKLTNNNNAENKSTDCYVLVIGH